jgi:hypothetical protein
MGWWEGENHVTVPTVATVYVILISLNLSTSELTVSGGRVSYGSRSDHSPVRPGWMDDIVWPESRLTNGALRPVTRSLSEWTRETLQQELLRRV